MGTQFRNVGIVAHIDAGKTTLTERILFVTNVIWRMGEVQDGTTVTDWLPQERERGISINAAFVTCRWKDWTINVVDTPGHIDFTEEVERSLGVMDGVIAVVCAVKGVQAQTESVWRRASRFRLPALAYVNKMDRDGADPERAVRQISERFSVTAVPLQYPIGVGKDFLGVVDLISRRFTGMDESAFGDVNSQVVNELRRHEIEIEIAREHLVECLAEVDDTVLGDYLGGRESDEAVLRKAMRRAVVKRRIVPVLFGSSLQNKGVAELLDAVGEYLPAPFERAVQPEYTDETGCECRSDGAVAMVFRICDSPYGRLACVRVFRGIIQAGAIFKDTRTGEQKRVRAVWRILASDLEATDSGETGSIVALEGDWSRTRTGDFLAAEGVCVKSQRLHFPQPVVSVNVEAADGAGEQRLEQVLKSLLRDSTTMQAHRIPGTRGWTFSGMGELQIEVLLDTLDKEYGIKTKAGVPRVEYRRTIQGRAKGEGLFEKRFPNGVEVSAGVEVEVEPLEQGKGCKENFDCLRECLPENLARSVRQGVMNIVNAENSGFPMTDMKVTVLRVFSLKGEALEPALVTAAKSAVENAVSAAGCCVLEPVMKLEVNTPSDTLGSVLADLNSRHANVLQVESLAVGLSRIVALAPLAEIFGYASSLRSLSAGRGEVVAEPASYRSVLRTKQDAQENKVKNDG